MNVFRWVLVALPSTPKYTAGSIIYVADRDGNVLLVQSRFSKKWGFPGGFHRRRETPLITAARELREETGIDREPDHFTLQLTYLQERARHFDSLAILRLPDPQPSVARGPGLRTWLEVKNARWYDLDDETKLPRRLRRETELALTKLSELGEVER